jgi:hypothetical protein
VAICDTYQRGIGVDTMKTAQDWQTFLELKQDTGLRIGVWEWDLDTNTVAWSDES